MNDRDIDILLDKFARAVLLHGGDEEAIEKCEHCRVVRARIKTVFREAEAKSVDTMESDVASSFAPSHHSESGK